MRGRWLSPDGTVVGVSGDVYESRGPSTISVNFNRSRRNEAVQTGIFRCEMPDASGFNRITYIGLYSSDLTSGRHIHVQYAHEIPQSGDQRISLWNLTSYAQFSELCSDSICLALSY